MGGGFHLCCGHHVGSSDDYVGIEFEDYIVDRGDLENGGGMGVVYMPICKPCLPKYLKEFNAKITKDEPLIEEGYFDNERFERG